MKKLIVIRGSDQGAIGYETAIGEGHMLVRNLNDGQLVIVARHHTLEFTPEISEAIEGLSPDNVKKLLDATFDEDPS